MDRSALTCSVNRGLWEEVGLNLRVGLAREDAKTIRLRFYINGEPSENDI